MKITVSFEELGRVLGFSSVILSDKIVEDRLKNVIFMVEKDAVKIAFYNALTFCRTVLEGVEVEGVDSPVLFQVKYQELMKILSGFSSLYKTKVDKMVFEENGSKVAVSVYEVAVKEEDSRLNQVSRFKLDRVPILDSIEKDVKMEFPEESNIVPSGDVLLYVDSLLPIMVNDSNNAIGSKLNMADDYVFVLRSDMSVFFKNKLPEAFKGLTLGYSSANFLRKLCDLGDMSVKREGKFLCVSVGYTEAFMRYQNVKIKYKQYIDRFNRDNGLLLNRLYLKDVLKRMSSMSPDGKLTVLENGDISVENDNFNQVVPVDRQKGEVKGISFKISVPTIEKLVIGKDTAFPEEIFIYLSKVGSGYTLFISDKTGAWFSQAQVR